MRLRSLLGATTLLLTALTTTLVTVPGSATASGPDRLDEIAAANHMSRAKLVKLMKDETFRIGVNDHAYYVDAPRTASPGPVNIEVAPFPLDQTFLLHSLAGSQRTIYLDFNGQNVSNTAWNGGPPAGNNLPNGDHPAWDPAGNAPRSPTPSWKWSRTSGGAWPRTTRPSAWT